jgi:hypothetical protein
MNPQYAVEIWSRAHRAWVVDGWCRTREVAEAHARDERAVGTRTRVRYVAAGMP